MSDIELGTEPPLSVSRSAGVPVRRAVSVRWLTGTVLTGLTSIGLMGGALLTALDINDLLGAAPQSIAGLPIAGSANAKGDRIQSAPPPESTRQVIPVSVVIEQGDVRTMRERPFAFINAALAAPHEVDIEVPPYDAMTIITDGAAAGAVNQGETTEQIYGAQVDGEVTVTISPFPLDAPLGSDSVSFAAAEVQEILRDASAELASGGAMQVAALGLAGSGFAMEMFSAGGEARVPGVQIIPENISFVSKSEANGTDFTLESVEVLAAGETLEQALTRLGVTDADADEAMSVMTGIIDVEGLSTDNAIRLAFAEGAAPDEIPPVLRISIYTGGVHQATVARNDAGTFVRANEPGPLPQITEGMTAAPAPGQLPRLYDALYLSAAEQGLPEPLIRELIHIFAFDLDLQARVTSGDSVQVFHGLPESAESEPPEIVYASVTHSGVTKRYYRYLTPDDGIVDYYDAEGRSANVFLLRQPIVGGRFTSGFGYRRDPFVGSRTMHNGVDWAAPIGTPIMAAGDGTVVFAGRNGGYGNIVRIQHTNGYETAYAHQSRIADGIQPGVAVRQGQVIGYVGSTGRSTGAHLHYEIRINGNLQDPLRIALPRGRILQGDILAGFLVERNRVDALLGIEPDTTDLAAR
ncbi:MAG: M23 family metallopeptidase [Bauldia sp.]|nr:M23 family metallopeptidase [Bauldia sp.]